MHELPSLMVLQQAAASPKTGEDLEVLGKYAARQYSEGREKTLTSAVVSAVKQAGLSPEQVRRVVEFANVNAYLDEHRKEGAVHKYVDFFGGPANAGDVLRDLNDGGGGTVFDNGLGDYSRPPMAKAASSREVLLGRNLEALSALGPAQGLEKAAAQGFGPSLSDLAGDMAADASPFKGLSVRHSGGFDPTGDQERRRHAAILSAITGRSPVVVKHGSAPFPLDLDPAETALKEAFAVEEASVTYAEPFADALDMREKLAGATDTLTSQLTELEWRFQEALGGLYSEVKQASLQGVPVGQILAAWHAFTVDPEYVKTAFTHIGPKLVQEGVFPSLDELGASMAKTAHAGIPNLDHPICSAMGQYCVLLDKMASVRAARDELASERDRMTAFLHKTAGVVDAVKGLAKGVADKGGIVPKVTSAFRSAGDAGGKATKGLGEFLFGSGSRGADIAGKAVQKGVTYTPHALGALGGVMALEEAHQRASYSPTFQTTKNFVLSRVPYTHQNMLQKNQAAMEGAYGLY